MVKWNLADPGLPISIFSSCASYAPDPIATGDADEAVALPLIVHCAKAGSLRSVTMVSVAMGAIRVRLQNVAGRRLSSMRQGLGHE